jgi:hypothetical protein
VLIALVKKIEKNHENITKIDWVSYSILRRRSN